MIFCLRIFWARWVSRLMPAAAGAPATAAESAFGWAHPSPRIHDRNLRQNSPLGQLPRTLRRRLEWARALRATRSLAFWGAGAPATATRNDTFDYVASNVDADADNGYYSCDFTILERLPHVARIARMEASRGRLGSANVAQAAGKRLRSRRRSRRA